ncbi:hypothetical protein GCM10011378_32620 [Hymenobacter glacieicola]|uniref:Uncharacterized protein n=2 Tax=Hymenobacter glacieicola TaxID=1562124 RepID=A0ABQ1X1V4_9BACT|nr:hypothetical protein GCM10011378_32620 [Hymenobacter glacieicola]
MLLPQLPHCFLLLHVFGSSAPKGAGNGIQYIILAQALFSLVLVVAIGLGIRSGRLWASVLFVFYLLWQAFLTLSSFLAPPTDLLARALILLPFGCLLVVGLFLFRNSFTRRPAAPVAEGH